MSRYQEFFEMMVQEHGITLLEGQMQDIIHEVHKIYGWRSVKDELPDFGLEVLISYRTPGLNCPFSEFSRLIEEIRSIKGSQLIWQGGTERKDVTHWMYKPQDPNNY